MRWDLLLPNSSEMYNYASENTYYLLASWKDTLSVSLLSAAFSVFISVLLSIVCLRVIFLKRVLELLVVVSQSFPLQVISPLIIILLGTGFHSKLLISIAIAFFPIFFSTMNALVQIPHPLLAFINVANGSFLKSTFLVRLPYAFPDIVAASKAGFTLAVLGTVVAEFIQPESGLGKIIIVSQSQFDVSVIFLCILLLAIQGLAFYGLLTIVELRLKPRR